MFDNAKDQANNPQPQPPTPPEAKNNSVEKKLVGKEGEERIKTMPMEYYLGDKTTQVAKGAKPAPGPVASSAPKKAGDKKWLTILLIVGAVIVLAASGWLMYLSMVPAEETTDQAVPDTEAVSEANQADEAEELADMEGESGDALDEEEEELEESDLEEPEVAEEEEEKQAKFNPAEISKFSLSLMSGPDKDKDGLTDEEEALIGTKDGLVDSDDDTYGDLEEIKNFYSPLDASATRFWEKDFVKYYTNNTYGYKILYPTAWLIAPLDSDNPDDLMISTNQNEFINIIVDEKPAGQSLQAWYLEKAPSVKIADLKKFKTFNKLDVIESPDAFTVYIEKDNQVFIINYNIGLKEVASYPNVFQMLFNSFEFIEAEE
ncbi:hypothetical protein HQ571_03910 [Candidatus Kuenenbacteria bacterium]|nr:hypothetical protein [Candidatus Kuenenbacteria bacterium]